MPALFALLGSALVLVLGLVSVSPALHAQLHTPAVQAECAHPHHHVPDDAEHDVTCVVELFAAGVSVPVDPTHLVVAPLATIAEHFLGGHEIAIVAPEHRQPPGRGPPRV